MKEIRETKLVEQTTVKFVANDGTVFDDESKCAAYERQSNETECIKAFQKIFISSIDPPLVKWYYGEDAGLDIVHLNDVHDFDAMIDYYKAIKNKDVIDLAQRRNEIKYPAKYMVTYGYEWILFSEETIEELRKKYIEVANNLPSDE